MLSESKALLYCAFCGKSQHEVKQLIVGPRSIGICNECAFLCAKTCAEEMAKRTRFGEVTDWYLHLTAAEMISLADTNCTAAELAKGGDVMLAGEMSATELLGGIRRGIKALRDDADRKAAAAAT